MHRFYTLTSEIKIINPTRIHTCHLHPLIQVFTSDKKNEAQTLSSRGRRSSGPSEVGQAEVTSGGGGSEGEDYGGGDDPICSGGGARRPRFVGGASLSGSWDEPRLRSHENRGGRKMRGGAGGGGPAAGGGAATAVNPRASERERSRVGSARTVCFRRANCFRMAIRA